MRPRRVRHAKGVSCRFTFAATETDPDVRLSFHVGDAVGKVSLAAVVFRTTELRGLDEDEDPVSGTVRRLPSAEFEMVTAARFRDEGRFYFETERADDHDMASFLRNEVGLRALLEGTNHNDGLPWLWAESTLDLMDCHSTPMPQPDDCASSVATKSRTWPGDGGRQTSLKRAIGPGIH